MGSGQTPHITQSELDGFPGLQLGQEVDDHRFKRSSSPRCCRNSGRANAGHISDSFIAALERDAGMRKRPRAGSYLHTTLYVRMRRLLTDQQ